MQQSVTLFNQPERVSWFPLASSMSPSCLEGRAQLRGAAHSHNGPAFPPQRHGTQQQFVSRDQQLPQLSCANFF